VRELQARTGGAGSANGAPARPALELERGVRVDPATLPPDVVAAARAAFAAGDPVLALSLLYRGALVHLVERCGLELPASATEGDCTRLARRRLDPVLAADFGALTRVWQFCAYGQEQPDAATFGELCQRWAERLARHA